MKTRHAIGFAACVCMIGSWSGCAAKPDSAGSNPRDPILAQAAGTSGSAVGVPGGATPTAGAPARNLGPTTASTQPLAGMSTLTTVRKVKNLLTGLPPTDADVAALRTTGAAGLQQLVDTWITDPMYEPLFRSKMLGFFRNAFQQVGFTPTEDFKPQLLQNGGFDFGPFGASAVGDDAFARLVKNVEDSFAMTALALVAERRPLSEVLTTRRYMMTTGLKSLYLQVEMPNDQPFAFNFRGTGAPPLAWRIDYSGTPIPLEQSLDPSSPNFMVFDDQAPAAPSLFGSFGGSAFQTCRGGTAMDSKGMVVASAPFNGNAMLFQRMLGFTPRYPFAMTPTCWEHASKPYFTADDMSDWKWVTVRPLAAGEAYLRPYDLPKLRTTTELGLVLPRVGFYTTPAFLALWNTNDSNQHRVTANQTLLVALGTSFTSADAIIPLSAAGLDSMHSVSGSECYGCHKNLDPMRQFWANQFDFNDRNDFPTISFLMTASNPRPKTLGGGFAFANVNSSGGSMMDFGGLIAQVTFSTPEGPLSGFASEMTRKLCFYANSTACDLEDPEFRRIARAFQDRNFDFLVLVRELFASPLVTGASATMTFPVDEMPPSIERRDHLCAALSNRLGKPDLCALTATMPSAAQTATARIANTVASDAFSRGSESPITSADPTLFYRAASEMLCENVSNQVIDAPGGSMYSSGDPNTALPDMVARLMGYPPGDPEHASALQIVKRHYDEVLAQNKRQPAIALRSAFVLACEAPTALGIGL